MPQYTTTAKNYASCLPFFLSSFFFVCAGGMVEFRRSLAASFLFKSLLYVAQQMEADVPAYSSPFPDNYKSGKRRCRI